jgi:hypothetical protein
LTNETFIEMSFEDWVKEYKPIYNHIDPNASFQDESDNGLMFETYGDEVEFVKSQDPAKIWMYGDGDDGGSYIWNGWHIVNRIGYFVTEVPCPPDTTIQIQIGESPEECEKCGVYIYDPEEDDHECEED